MGIILLSTCSESSNKTRESKKNNFTRMFQECWKRPAFRPQVSEWVHLKSKRHFDDKKEFAFPPSSGPWGCLLATPGYKPYPKTPSASPLQLPVTSQSKHWLSLQLPFSSQIIHDFTLSTVNKVYYEKFWKHYLNRNPHPPSPSRQHRTWWNWKAPVPGLLQLIFVPQAQYSRFFSLSLPIH